MRLGPISLWLSENPTRSADIYCRSCGKELDVTMNDTYSYDPKTGLRRQYESLRCPSRWQLFHDYDKFIHYKEYR